MITTDPIVLARDLIRCPSVTPEDAGALSVLEGALDSLGFALHRLRFEADDAAPVENLYARLGQSAPHFCFAGHTDVVPAGNHADWRSEPFAGDIHEGVLYGRGAADMKSAIAAFIAAVSRHIAAHGRPKGSISLLITGDEEGIAVNGTIKVLKWMKKNGEVVDHCLVGEPTSAVRVGDVIKIGRRGSMNFRAVVKGVQGHAAYPKRSLNPIPIMAALIERLSSWTIDEGSPHFEASTLAFTTVDAGNPAVNVTPGEVRAGFNIRFNELHTPQSLLHSIQAIADSVQRDKGGIIDLVHAVSGVSFLTEPGAYTLLLRDAVEDATGHAPEYSTTGGTSDARFIKDHCPVAELGLTGATMHKVNECASLEDIETLTRIYQAVLKRYFAQPSGPSR